MREDVNPENALEIIFENDVASRVPQRQFEFLVMELWPILLGVRRGGNKVGEKWRKSSRSEAFSAQSNVT